MGEIANGHIIAKIRILYVTTKRCNSDQLMWLKKRSNWSELHLSDVISYKIHTLINTFLDFLALKWPFIGQPLVISLVPYNSPIFKSIFLLVPSQFMKIRLKFYDYHRFQHKRYWANTYAHNCNLKLNNCHKP